MVKRVLMIAYHYPPLQGSSGIQRTLKFSQYLPESDWQPIILGAHPRAFPMSDNVQSTEIPASVSVYRPFALDAAKHCSVRGKYPLLLALPDRWASWWLGAVPAGLRIIRKYRPDVIWSTYPIATAHLIGLTLNRLTGIPWVADFRDPMADEDVPMKGIQRRIHEWIERNTIKYCTHAVVTTPGALRIYRERYPALPRHKFSCISNGFDEENFTDAEKRLPVAPAVRTGPVVLLHSGIVYSLERNPVHLFMAIAALLQARKISAQTCRIVLRATQNDAALKQMIAEYGIAGIVELAPYIPYRQALTEMLTTDGLLILQASNCNHQIPAKLYEYMRAGRPVLALTDPVGDTAKLLQEAGIHTIAPLDDVEAIQQTLLDFLTAVQQGRGNSASPDYVARCSRKARTGELAKLLNGCMR
ncbi:MAG: glycosyltransferase [Burkholderiales bacterium]